MAEKAKEKETKAVTPWRPFMGLTGWERDTDRMAQKVLPYVVDLGRKMRLEVILPAPLRFATGHLGGRIWGL